MFLLLLRISCFHQIIYVVYGIYRNPNQRVLNRNRKLLPNKDGDNSKYNYTGCLSMTVEELESSWVFPGEIPKCTGGISDTSFTSSYNDYDDDYSFLSLTVSNFYSSFNAQDCSFYENVWLWDLALSCSDLSTLEGCQCTFAEEIYKQGSITCASSSSSSTACPEDCSVCQTCMTIIGCDTIYGSTQKGLANFIPYFIASSIGLGLSAMILYSSKESQRRRRRINNNNTSNTQVSNEITKKEMKRKQQTWLAPMLI